jgi:hypothetical protein
MRAVAPELADTLRLLLEWHASSRDDAERDDVAGLYENLISRILASPEGLNWLADQDLPISARPVRMAPEVAAQIEPKLKAWKALPQRERERYRHARIRDVVVTRAGSLALTRRVRGVSPRLPAPRGRTRRSAPARRRSRAPSRDGPSSSRSSDDDPSRPGLLAASSRLSRRAPREGMRS